MELSYHPIHLKYLNEGVISPEHSYAQFPTEAENIIFLVVKSRVSKLTEKIRLEYFYCIKNDESYYTSIVEFRLNELIWFTLEEFRGQGILYNGLKNSILKMAKERGWDGYITILNDGSGNQSRKLALALNFVEIDDWGSIKKYYYAGNYD